MPIPAKHQKAYGGFENRLKQYLKLMDDYLIAQQKAEREEWSFKMQKDYLDKQNQIKALIQDLPNMQLSNQPPPDINTLLKSELKKGVSDFDPNSDLHANIAKFQVEIKNSYLGSEIWKTNDPDFDGLMGHIKKFKAKEGGAKQAGKRTGVYTFDDESGNKEMMLIKQGDNVGETIAEYVGGQLYQMTIPEHAAKAFLVRDQTGTSINDVYVTSVYEKNAKSVVDAYEIAGLKERRSIFGEIWKRGANKVKKFFGSKDQSDFRKILRHDEIEAGNSLGYSMANVLWHGDHDVHMGNFVHVEKNDGQKKFMKIDHGFSFFNFDDDVVDIMGSPMKGKVASLSVSRWAKGGKLFEAYPFNNFWSMAAERKRFYFSGPFIKGCEDIASLKEEGIRGNLRKSLAEVRDIYQPNAVDALMQFGERLGLNSESMNKKVEGVDNVEEIILHNIENHMVLKMQKRQQSMSKMADFCRGQASKLTTEHHKLSREMDKQVIKLLDEKAKNEVDLNKFVNALHNTSSKEQTESIKEEMAILMNKNFALTSEIRFFKMLEQANDMGYLTVNNDNELSIKDSFYFYDEGHKQQINKEEFDNEMKKITKLKEVGDLSNKDTAKVLKDTIALSDDSYHIYEDVKIRLPKFEEKAAKADQQQKAKDSRRHSR